MKAYYCELCNKYFEKPYVVNQEDSRGQYGVDTCPICINRVEWKDAPEGQEIIKRCIRCKDRRFVKTHKYWGCPDGVEKDIKNYRWMAVYHINDVPKDKRYSHSHMETMDPCPVCKGGHHE